jgi:uroporphyrin-III C-methyltransferase
VTVHLVGAGPGDPDLLTLRAARLLASADVVVHDRLAAGVLSMVSPWAELIDVGKRHGDSHTQESINALLVELGRRHECVVRLKGGDPYVFGRGGEEAMALTEAGIGWEVVPGVSAAISAPAAAGVPVTHRLLADSFTVVTGHRAAEASTDWAALAQAGGTLVVVMGVAQRAEIAAALMAAGLDGDTPVAAVCDGCTPRQRTVRTTLAELGAAPVDAPATIVIGAVAALDLHGDIALAARSGRHASAMMDG